MNLLGDSWSPISSPPASDIHLCTSDAGRAEASRLVCIVGGIAFEVRAPPFDSLMDSLGKTSDEHTIMHRTETSTLATEAAGLAPCLQDIHLNPGADAAAYAALKAKAPFGQFPVLELADGRMLAQSQAMGGCWWGGGCMGDVVAGGNGRKGGGVVGYTGIWAVGAWLLGDVGAWVASGCPCHPCHP